jgi:3-deoxy-manno-octulosonate cytidylyltransferase (CMP-KDO synthetase)
LVTLTTIQKAQLAACRHSLNCTELYLPKIAEALNPFLALQSDFTPFHMISAVSSMQKMKYVMNCRIMRTSKEKMNANTVIIIPARMAASRLPGKPLADIAGKPMIQHVWERALAADIAPVYVATDHADIANVITGAGGMAVMTSADHQSGSDRVFEAVQSIDPANQYQTILNLQGDLPDLAADIPTILAATLEDSNADLATLVTRASMEEVARPQVVKAVVSWDMPDEAIGRALYFSRAPIPTGAKQHWHHIGVYGWRRDALARFVSLPPSPLETAEKLEQLRAIEAGMHVAIAKVEAAPGGVDTVDDLEAARHRIGHP